VLAVVLVVLVVCGVWVRVADPVALRGEPPQVDPSDPPNGVVADAVERLEYLDYTYRVQPSRVTDQITRVENSHRETFTTIGGFRKRYRAEGELWLKFQGEGWRSVDSPGFTHENATPFDPDPLRAADATVLANESGTLVVAVNDSATVSAVLRRDVSSGSLLFAVNLRSGRLTGARFVRDVGDGTRTWSYRFYGYGRTSVERPSAIPDRTIEQTLEDVLSG
jgi:hypothetical protein